MTKVQPKLPGSVPAHDALEPLVSRWARQLHISGVTPTSLRELVNDVLADTWLPHTTGHEQRAQQLFAEAVSSVSVGTKPRLEDQIRILVLYHGVDAACRLIVARAGRGGTQGFQ